MMVTSWAAVSRSLASVLSNSRTASGWVVKTDAAAGLRTCSMTCVTMNLWLLCVCDFHLQIECFFYEWKCIPVTCTSFTVLSLFDFAIMCTLPLVVKFTWLAPDSSLFFPRFIGTFSLGSSH
jgi:hypothetical protein